MAVTYTPNIGLGMQENKSDYLNWDVIVANWKILDRVIGDLMQGGSGIIIGNSELISDGQDTSEVGSVTDLEGV